MIVTHLSRKEIVFFALLTLYIVVLLSSNILGVKLTNIFFGLPISVSIFYFPFLFLITDVVGEVFGKEKARLVVYCGIGAMITYFIISLLSVLLPWHNDSIKFSDAYNQIIGTTIRMSIASLVAFIVSELQDVTLFFKFKELFKNKSFWKSSQLSNVVSQYIDSLLFGCIAFIGILPFSTILVSSTMWWVYKVVAGVLYSPLTLYIIKKVK